MVDHIYSKCSHGFEQRRFIPGVYMVHHASLLFLTQPNQFDLLLIYSLKPLITWAAVVELSVNASQATEGPFNGCIEKA